MELTLQSQDVGSIMGVSHVRSPPPAVQPEDQGQLLEDGSGWHHVGPVGTIPTALAYLRGKDKTNLTLGGTAQGSAAVGDGD